MKYSEVMKDLNRKIFKWYYAIPIGIIAHIIYRCLSPLGGIFDIIGTAIGVFGILIFVGLISGFIDLVKFAINKIKNKKK